MAYRGISQEEKLKANTALRPFGLEVSGGSYNSVTERFCIAIEKYVAATYDEPRVADLLMKELGGKTIELDSKVFPKQKA